MPKSRIRPVALATPAVSGQASAHEIYRHTLPVRLFHWINVVCFVLLLASGLAIFNLYPRLNWGAAGFTVSVAINPSLRSDLDTPAIFEIGGLPDIKRHQSWMRIGSHQIDTSGLLGVAADEPPFGVQNIAFPPWMTLNLGFLGARGLHLLINLFFLCNFAFYALYGVASGRFRRTLLPNRDQLRPKAIARDLWMHLRLKHSVGLDAARYNLLQKISYLAVLVVLMPASILSGLTMSPSALAAFPWLLELFDGRQSARTIHFICAMLLLLFAFVHIFQVVVAGFANEMRSMITGRFRIQKE